MTVPSEFWNMVDQIGIVVSDIEKVVAFHRNIMGIEPYIRKTTVPGQQKSFYLGNPRYCSFELAFYKIGNMEFEYVCPRIGDSLHHRFLREHGEGLEPLRFNVESYERAVREMEDLGYPVVMNGETQFGNGTSWAIIDTFAALGYYVEITNRREIQKKGESLS